MNKGSQLNKESGVSNEQGVPAEQGSQMNKGPWLNDSSELLLRNCHTLAIGKNETFVCKILENAGPLGFKDNNF